ncbi:MAG: uracil-DNA glycosylase [Chitinivibrionia bacterium]|nr:uracil-DNA glycosylase [Chitinivibrionia bacterium]
MTKFSLIEKYFKGQKELGFPNYLILDKSFNLSKINAKSKQTPTIKNEKKVEILQPIFEKVAQQSAIKIERNFQIEQPITEEKNIDKREKLIELYERCKNCSACSLSKTRKKFVFGAGTVFTDVLAIGEAPGEQEDNEGLPFVGAAGQLLTKMLAAINLQRNEIFIANILKCRPPQNRKPNSQEIATCFHILKRQIEIINPKALLLLGGTAANAVLQNDKSVGALRGIVHYYENIPAIVSYHPSALLRDASWKKYAWEDLQKFERLLKELRNAQ